MSDSNQITAHEKKSAKALCIYTLSLVAVAALFLLVSLFVQTHEHEMRSFAEVSGMLGMLLYVGITILAIVVAPISTLPLIPVASGMWGWFITGVLSIIGWLIGAQIAFFLARRFGKPLVQKFVSIEKINTFEKRLPKKHIFWTVVFMRMFIPVDVLSYLLGLLSSMSALSYFWATIIGITPFAFIFSYAGILPIRLQIAAFFVAGLIAILGYRHGAQPVS